MNFFWDLTKKILSLKLKKKIGPRFFFGPYQIGGPRRVPNSPRLWAGHARNYADYKKPSILSPFFFKPFFGIKKTQIILSLFFFSPFQNDSTYSILILS
jgi:hypothetical protein